MPRWSRAALLTDPTPDRGGTCYRARPLQVEPLRARPGRPINRRLYRGVRIAAEFVVRRRAGVKIGDRIRHLGSDYEVVSLSNLPPRGHRLKAMTKRVRPSRLLAPITIGGEPLTLRPVVGRTVLTAGGVRLTAGGAELVFGGRLGDPQTVEVCDG